jgi:hypothetical protein
LFFYRLDQPAKKELSMIPSNSGSVPEESTHRKDGAQEKDEVVDCSDHGPMPQQYDVSFHSHDMHPQKFVHLVGCHDLKAGKHPRADRSH